MLTYRPVDETAHDLPGVNVREIKRHRDVIKCVIARFARPIAFDGDVVRPYPDPRDWVSRRSRPSPGPERMKARADIRRAVVASAPASRKHSSQHHGIEVTPELWQWSVSADDAVKRQDQRHRHGLLEVSSARDLGEKVLAQLR